MKKLSLIAAMLLIAASVSASDNENYKRVEVSYNPIAAEDTDLTGITAGYTQAFNVTSKPLFVEVGGRFTYAFGDENGAKSKFIQLAVPVNVVYKYTLPSNSDFSIAPFAGVVFKGNIAGETKNNGNKADWFDKKDEGGLDANRFQMGWNVGVGVNYKQYYLGVSYGAEFMELADDVSTSNYAITLGYTF